jgi:hypothetical protein
MLQSALMELSQDPIVQDAPTCMEMEGPADAVYDDMMDQVP